MILKLAERYRHNNYLKGLNTFLFEFDTLSYEVIDMLDAIHKLESDKNFMELWKDDNSNQYKKIKCCLCKDRPYIESLFDNDGFYLNDYNMLIGTDIIPNYCVIASINKNNKITHILIDKRRFDSCLINDNGEVISNNIFV